MKLGDALLNEISESQRNKGQDMIESTDYFTDSSPKTWKTINKLTKDHTAPQQQCRVIADQVAHQLLLNGKENKDHKEKKRPNQEATESMLASPLQMKDLHKGINGGPREGACSMAVPAMRTKPKTSALRIHSTHAVIRNDNHRYQY